MIRCHLESVLSPSRCPPPPKPPGLDGSGLSRSRIKGRTGLFRAELYLAEIDNCQDN